MENDQIIDKAVAVLKNGGIIIYPTDTAFGIGCLANNPKAIKMLFEIRKRPSDSAVTLLVNSINMASKYFRDLTPQVIRLMEKYWPGALSIVYYCNKDKVDPLVSSGGDTVGLRAPNHKMTLEIIKRSDVPLLGPSANFHNGKTPFKIEDLDKELVKLVDFVVPGKSNGSKASTIVDCTKTPFQILRKGAVNFYTLLIDSGGVDKTSVSLSFGKIKFKKEENSKAQVTLSLIDKILKENNLKLKDIAQIKLGTQKDSFIGLRIGQTIAKTLGYLLNIPVFIILFFFVFQTPQVFALDIKNLVNQSIQSNSSTYSNSNYTNSTNRFQTGNTIYIKIDTTSTGSKNRIIRILDSNKNLVSNVNTNVKSANNQLQYTGSINLNNPGTYYLDVKIEDDSNSFSLQQNIEITGTGKSEIKPKEEVNISIIPTVSGENKFIASNASDTIATQTAQQNNIIQNIKNLFNKIGQYLLNFVKNNPLTRK
ncbi:threonylcarbamoyl-AMP synthase [Candidatus Gottesmanbacteria bacterium]|nr:threonylcarbamoyl-AMP synthase [Candidatus Gottesmanbacteria bacterium]